MTIGTPRTPRTTTTTRTSWTPRKTATTVVFCFYKSGQGRYLNQFRISKQKSFFVKWRKSAFTCVQLEALSLTRSLISETSNRCYEEPMTEQPGCKVNVRYFYYDVVKDLCQVYESNGCPLTKNYFLTPENCKTECLTDRVNFLVTGEGER